MAFRQTQALIGVKKVLIITYYWPPAGGGGVQRWLKFVKYLRQYGWEPIVFTPENPEVPALDNSLLQEVPEKLTVLKTKIWEPYLLYKRFTGRKKDERVQTAFLTEKKKPGLAEKLSIWVRGNLFIPDARMSWIRPSVRFLQHWITENPVNLIVSTGPPHSAHLIAEKLKQKANLPWLADFRDPWTNIDYYKDLRLTRCADRKHRRLEKRVLQTADAVTVISKGMIQDFNSIHARDYHLITNGFDAADFDQALNDTHPATFRLSHMGSLVKTRNPLVLWQALSELVAENPAFARSLEIQLTGTVDLLVRQSLKESGLEAFVHYEPYRPHDQLAGLYSQSSVLLLLINNTPNAGLILTGKFFEYMAARRPIICIGPTDGDAARILKETHSGYTFGFRDKAQLKNKIAELFAAYQNGDLRLASKGIEAYSRQNLTGKLALLMDGMLLKK